MHLQTRLLLGPVSSAPVHQGNPVYVGISPEYYGVAAALAGVAAVVVAVRGTSDVPQKFCPSHARECGWFPAKPAGVPLS